MADQPIMESLNSKIKGLIDAKFAQMLTIDNVRAAMGGGWRSMGGKYVGIRQFNSDNSSHVVGTNGGGTTVT